MDYSDLLGALTTTRSAMTSGRSAYDQALASQLGALEQPVDRRGALMRMAQGFLSPTRTGGFAENAGMAIGNYADANDKMRDQEMDRAMKLAQIQAARAKLQMEGAGQDFDLFSKGHGMMQDQRRQQAGLDFDGSIGNVARQAMEGIGEAMPSLPGSPINDPAMFSQNPTQTPQQTRQVAQPATEEGQPDLPVRHVSPPTEPGIGPMPDTGAALQMPTYTQLAPSGFSPDMIDAPVNSVGRVLRNDKIPQQAAPQQSPQQAQRPAADSTILGMPRPQGPVAGRAWDMLNALHGPQGERLRNENPQGWADREKQAMTALKDTPEYKDSISERRLKERQMVENGVPQNIASGITSGQIKIDRHPISGRAQVVDLATGNIIQEGRNAERTAAAAASGGEGESGLRPSGIADSEVSSATGVGGFARSTANTIAEYFGGELPFEETERAQQLLGNLRARTRIALASEVSGRPSNLLLELFDTMAVTPADINMGPERARQRFGATLDFIEDQKRTLDILIENQENLPPQQVGQALVAREQIAPLLRDYRMVFESFGPGGRNDGAPTGEAPTGASVQPPVPAPQGIPSDEWPEIWDQMSEEDRKLWQ